MDEHRALLEAQKVQMVGVLPNVLIEVVAQYVPTLPFTLAFWVQSKIESIVLTNCLKCAKVVGGILPLNDVSLIYCLRGHLSFRVGETYMWKSFDVLKDAEVVPDSPEIAKQLDNYMLRLEQDRPTWQK